MATAPRYIRQETWDEETTHKATRGSLDSKQKEQLDYLYARLGIIDNKVASLLTLNTVMLAAAAIIVSVEANSQFFGRNKYALLLATLCWLVSTGCCLAINFLKWERLGANGLDYDNYCNRIIGVTIRRTAIYNVANGLMCAAIILVVAVFAPKMIGGG